MNKIFILNNSETGELYCWGYNKYGQSGLENTENELLPQIVATMKNKITQFSCGYNHTFAISGIYF